MSDSLRGIVSGFEPKATTHEPPLAEGYPKWVEVHADRVVRNAHGDAVSVLGFAEFFVDRLTKDIAVMVANVAEEKAAGSAK